MAAAAKSEVRFFFSALIEIGENEKKFFLADANGADAADGENAGRIPAL